MSLLIEAIQREVAQQNAALIGGQRADILGEAQERTSYADYSDKSSYSDEAGWADQWNDAGHHSDTWSDSGTTTTTVDY